MKKTNSRKTCKWWKQANHRRENLKSQQKHGATFKVTSNQKNINQKPKQDYIIYPADVQKSQTLSIPQLDKAGKQEKPHIPGGNVNW